MKEMTESINNALKGFKSYPWVRTAMDDEGYRRIVMCLFTVPSSCCPSRVRRVATVMRCSDDELTKNGIKDINSGKGNELTRIKDSTGKLKLARFLEVYLKRFRRPLIVRPALGD
jgi:hypothetical protein